MQEENDLIQQSSLEGLSNDAKQSSLERLSNDELVEELKR